MLGRLNCALDIPFVSGLVSAGQSEHDFPAFFDE
jgi:hypothetical protein